MTLIFRLLASALALWVASEVVDGISVAAVDTEDKVVTLVAVAVVFGIVNAVVKPVVKVLAFPFYLLTLGLLTFVVNGLLLWLTAVLSDRLGLDFTVDGFVPAVLGAIVVSVVSLAANLVLPDND